MSKPCSGHFKGTNGFNSLRNKTSTNTNEYATMGLDLRAHPSKYKQFNSKKRKEYKAKEASRTLTREEFKRKEWQRRLNIRRKAGIDSFWDHEKYLIANNLHTTRNWSASQRLDILNNKRPKYKNVTMQSHHIYSVAAYPHLANKGSLIYPATHHEHLHRWHGGNYHTSSPGKPINHSIKEDF